MIVIGWSSKQVLADLAPTVVVNVCPAALPDQWWTTTHCIIFLAVLSLTAATWSLTECNRRHLT